MQQSPLQILLHDMHMAGISDVVSESTFQFYNEKIENPFLEKDIEAQQQPTSIQITTTSTKQSEKDTDKAKSIDDLVWQFGKASAQVKVVISSHADKGVHPLSEKAKMLFIKMLKAINIQESDISYIVLSQADKYSNLDKKTVKISLADLDEMSFKLFVGEEAVQCAMGETLIRFRQKEDLFYQNKPCGAVIHPESLLAQPALKKLAWLDLLKFSTSIKGGAI